MFGGMIFCQYSEGRHILYVIINTRQKIFWIKISPMSAGGEIGEKFLLVKVSCHTIQLNCYHILCMERGRERLALSFLSIQQMAYIQEQQRLAREEQKKRDLEIQKRKLMNINVANPTASSSLSFDDLVSSMKTSSSSSSSRSASPKVTRQTQDVAAPKSTAPVTGSGFDDPVPTQSIPTTSNNSDQWMPATAPVSSGSQPVSVPAAKQPDNTFEKLMESSLTNLRDTSPGRSRKMDFKTSSSKSGVKPSPLTSAQKTAFSESVRARAWTADGGDFSGVFAQHASQQQQLQQTTDLLGGDDSFGEFQSVGAGPPAAATSLIEPLGQSQGTQLAGLLDLQPTQQQAFQGQLPHIGDGSVHAVGTAQEQPRLRAATIHGGNTIPTSTYQHPIPSTSVAEKPQSPTATQFSSLDPSKFPTVYVEVFKCCSKAGKSFLDTELLFPLLMSSQLPKNVLRDLWSVANREVPGKLNQTELFVLLGLIGLAQVKRFQTKLRLACHGVLFFAQCSQEILLLHLKT